MTMNSHVVEHLHNNLAWMKFQTYLELRTTHLQSFSTVGQTERYSQQAFLVGMMPTQVYSATTKFGGDTQLFKIENDHKQPISVI